MKLSSPVANEDWVRFMSGIELPFPVRHKFMFGGVLFYFDGKPGAAVTSDGLGVKIAKRLHSGYIEKSRGLLFGDMVSKTYIKVPDHVVGDSETLKEWLIATQ